MDLGNYETGIRTIVRVFDELAATRSDASGSPPLCGLGGSGWVNSGRFRVLPCGHRTIPEESTA